MPIYAYRCSNCGHAQDVLQKMSDPLLTVCPVCGQSTYVKQVTAAGFQLKGSGWYVTDFRGGDATGKPAPEVTGDAGKGGDGGAEKSGGDASSKGDTKGGDSAKKGEGAAAPSPAPAPSPSASSGSASAPSAPSPSPAAAPPSSGKSST